MRELGILISFAGVLVLIGWWIGIPVLKSLGAGFVTMKVSTALSFVLNGILMYFMKSRDERGQHAGMAAAVSMLFLSTWLTVSAYTGFALGSAEDTSIETVYPGLKSLGTMLAFTLCGLGGISYLLTTKTGFVRAAGWSVVSIGCVALLGYLVGQPALYYYWPNLSTGMAIHTAALFVLCGIGFVRVK